MGKKILAALAAFMLLFGLVACGGDDDDDDDAAASDDTTEEMADEGGDEGGSELDPALATVCILGHAVFVSPLVWTLLRALVGASLIGIYIAVESWLNSRADRTNRGSILAVYEMVGLGALAAGQFLITVGDLRSPLPFLVAASLFALGLIPVALTRLPEPDLGAPSRLTDRSPISLPASLSIGERRIRPTSGNRPASRWSSHAPALGPVTS